MKRSNERCNLDGVHLAELHLKFGSDEVQVSAHAMYAMLSEFGPASVRGEMVGPWPQDIIEQIYKLRDDMENCLLQLHFETKEDGDESESDTTGEFGSILTNRLGKTSTEADQI